MQNWAVHFSPHLEEAGWFNHYKMSSPSRVCTHCPRPLHNKAFLLHSPLATYPSAKWTVFLLQRQPRVMQLWMLIVYHKMEPMLRRGWGWDARYTVVGPTSYYLFLISRKKKKKASGHKSKQYQGVGKQIFHDRRKPLPSAVHISSYCIGLAIRLLNKTALNKTTHEQNRVCNELSAQPNLTEVKNRERTKAGTALCISPVHDPCISSGPGEAGIKRLFRGEKVDVQIQCSLLRPLPRLRHKALMKMYRLNLMDSWTKSLPHLE